MGHNDQLRVKDRMTKSIMLLPRFGKLKANMNSPSALLPCSFLASPWLSLKTWSSCMLNFLNYKTVPKIIYHITFDCGQWTRVCAGGDIKLQELTV